MKKILLLILFAVSLNTQGQYSVGPTVMYGWSDMPNNIVSVRNSTDYTEYGTSYSVGIVNEYALKSWLSVELDFLYEYLSSQQFYFVNKDNPKGYRSTQSNEINYLTMPLMLKFKYKKLSLHLGAQASYYLTGYIKVATTDQFNNQTGYEGESNLAFNKWNMALTSAISYNIYKNFDLEFRYVNGLTNIMNEETGYKYYASTKQFLFGLNYKFDFKKKNTIKEAPESL